MKLHKRFLHSKSTYPRWVRIGYGMYIAGFAAMVALYLLAVGFDGPDIATRGEWYFIGLYIMLVVSPLVINFLLNNTIEEMQWRIRLQNVVRLSVLILSATSGMIWYLYPERTHLEPTTVLFGFAAAYITYEMETNKRKIADMLTP